MATRNFKLFNHWLAEVRSVALGKVFYNDDDDNEQSTRMMSVKDIRWVFNKELMSEYFYAGMSPDVAFYQEVNNWETI